MTEGTVVGPAVGLGVAADEDGAGVGELVGDGVEAGELDGVATGEGVLGETARKTDFYS